MKKTFYEVLWALCLKEGHLQEWVDQGYLKKSQLTYKWTNKTLDLLDLKMILGEKEIKDIHASTVVERSEFSLEPKGPFSIDPTQLNEFIQKFSKANTGIAGKTTDKNSVLKKLIKFFKDYPEYTMNNVLKATDAYIYNLKKTGSIQYIRECGYFIYKKVDGVDQSQLAKWCEESENNGTDYTSHRII
jgi:hypothetical protein